MNAIADFFIKQNPSSSVLPTFASNSARSAGEFATKNVLGQAPWKLLLPSWEWADFRGRGSLSSLKGPLLDGDGGPDFVTGKRSRLRRMGGSFGHCRANRLEFRTHVRHQPGAFKS